MSWPHVEDIELEYGITVKVYQEEGYPNPREDFDNMATLIIWNREGAHIGDQSAPLDMDYSEPDELVAYLRTDERMRFFTFVRFEDHGSNGARLHTWPDEEGANGIIYLDAATMKREYGVDRTDWLRTRVPPMLESEVEVVDQWLQGDIYWYAVEDARGETLDSCGGMYGFDYCKTEATEIAQHYIEQARKNELRSALALMTRERELLPI